MSFGLRHRKSALNTQQLNNVYTVAASSSRPQGSSNRGMLSRLRSRLTLRSRQQLRAGDTTAPAHTQPEQTTAAWADMSDGSFSSLDPDSAARLRARLGLRDPGTPTPGTRPAAASHSSTIRGHQRDLLEADEASVNSDAHDECRHREERDAVNDAFFSHENNETSILEPLTQKPSHSEQQSVPAPFVGYDPGSRADLTTVWAEEQVTENAVLPSGLADIQIARPLWRYPPHQNMYFHPIRPMLRFRPQPDQVQAYGNYMREYQHPERGQQHNPWAIGHVGNVNWAGDPNDTADVPTEAIPSVARPVPVQNITDVVQNLQAVVQTMSARFYQSRDQLQLARAHEQRLDDAIATLTPELDSLRLVYQARVRELAALENQIAQLDLVLDDAEGGSLDSIVLSTGNEMSGIVYGAIDEGPVTSTPPVHHPVDDDDFGYALSRR
jgi:hypothetical protein